MQVVAQRRQVPAGHVKVVQMELFGSWQLRPDGWQLAVEINDGDNKV